MTKEQIIQYLESIHEHKMASEIFVPVLQKMGLRGVKFTGGTTEYGIDIEYYELTQPENNRSYVGIQFKKGNLTYSSRGSKGTVKEVKNQAEEAFDKEIHDLEGRSLGYIGRFIVAVTGEINEQARGFIGRARLKGNDRRIDYWDGDRLAEYIIDHWMEEFIEYFDINLDDEVSEEEVFEIVDEEYLIENYKELIIKCIKVKSTVSGFEFDMLTSLAKLEVIDQFSSSVPFSEFLMEIERTEDYIEHELRNLVSTLNYIEPEDNQLYLNGHAKNLSTLLGTIIYELEEAEEDTENAFELFISVLN
ncbi:MULTISPECIES: restriction endonuclease [Bacillus cereus group]|uniref:restriction endonuclease n=1 Tax=Bacillus cereus group TaxID=86661 RepID=UPI001C0193FB|nr:MULTISPECIES: restriction endonuclease [Bacillus cereus group]QWJ06919.1 restriction endonuclease [Bacillus mycoides]